MISNRHVLLAACAGVIGFSSLASGAVVINEWVYDDTKTSDPGDSHEFVELYNNGVAPVDISGWVISGRDAVGNTNPTATVPASTVLAPGAFYVVGNAAVQNVNQTVAANFLENDAETIELRSTAGGALIDAVLYEANKGTASHGVLPADVLAKVNAGGNTNSPGYWGNHQSVEVSANNVTVSIGRYQDGVDTSNNGRDFGTRPSTPGASNSAGGSIVSLYTPANVDASAVGSNAAGLQAAFLGGAGQLYTPPSGAKVINPTALSTFNTNVIPASPQGGNAITVVDTSGGGATAVSFDTHQGNGGFLIDAYLDTSNLGNAAWVETSVYGTMGNIGSLFNTPDPEGDIFASAAPGNAGDNTGIGWMYQKFGDRATLYLVDAGDGGNSSPDVSPNEWVILQEFDLSTDSSAWHRLGITVDAAGNGVATLDAQTFNFTTAPNLNGEFYVGYREAMGAGTPGTPGVGEVYRPPTFDMVPEPSSLALLGLGGLALARRRRSA